MNRKYSYDYISYCGYDKELEKLFNTVAKEDVNCLRYKNIIEIKNKIKEIIFA